MDRAGVGLRRPAHPPAIQEAASGRGSATLEDGSDVPLPILALSF